MRGTTMKKSDVVKYRGQMYREACPSSSVSHDLVKEWEGVVLMLSQNQKHLGIWESDIRNGSRHLNAEHLKMLEERLQNASRTLSNLTAEAKDIVLHLRAFIEMAERGEVPTETKPEEGEPR